MRVAIVHEWLVTLGGSELVLAELLKIYPDAQVFALLDQMSDGPRTFLGVGDVRTSFLQSIPGIQKHYRTYLPLFPTAVRSLDVRGFDVVISNSHSVAKGIRQHPGQMHVSYCLSPMRYAWDLREQYLKESGNDRGIRGRLARGLLDSLRNWDKANSAGVDVFVTLSQYIAERIRRAYGRDSTVVYPPVDTNFFTPGRSSRSDGYYVTASRFVPYKRIDLIAKAFALLPDRHLVIVGEGPEDAKVRAAAGPNVELVGHVDRERLRDLLRGAKAFLFAAEEDFGIAPVEAQACGVPVIAYGRGGVTETVIASASEPGERRTGEFFEEQTADAIASAVRRFESRRIDPVACRLNAERFAEERFRREFAALVDWSWAQFVDRGRTTPPAAPAQE